MNYFEENIKKNTEISLQSKRHIIDFLRYLMNLNYSFYTVKNYYSDIKNFLIFINKEFSISSMEGVSLDLVRKYLSIRLQGGIKYKSNLRIVSTLKVFSSFLQKKHKICLKLQLHNFFKIKCIKYLPVLLTQDSIFNISNYYFIKWQDKRDVAIFYLMYTCGLRIGEVFKITKSVFIDAKKNSLLKISGKNNKERIVPILNDTIEKIEDYLCRSPFVLTHYHALFISSKGNPMTALAFQRKFQKWKILFNFPIHSTPHSLRHTFASRLLEEGVSIRYIKELLGHSSISTTQIYLHLIDRQVCSNYARFHPANL